jgi:hypothetical protein
MNVRKSLGSQEKQSEGSKKKEENKKEHII